MKTKLPRLYKSMKNKSDIQFDWLYKSHAEKILLWGHRNYKLKTKHTVSLMITANGSVD